MGMLKGVLVSSFGFFIGRFYVSAARCAAVGGDSLHAAPTNIDTHTQRPNDDSVVVFVVGGEVAAVNSVVVLD